MPNTLKVSQQNVISGLGSFTHTTLQNSMYYVRVRCSEVPTSGISIVVSQSGSGSASFTSPVPSAAQNHIELRCVINCAINDVITVALSSSTPQDQKLNAVKTTVEMGTGAN